MAAFTQTRGSCEGSSTRSLHTGSRALQPLSELVSRYYLRFEVVDVHSACSADTAARRHHRGRVFQEMVEGTKFGALKATIYAFILEDLGCLGRALPSKGGTAMVLWFRAIDI